MALLWVQAAVKGGRLKVTSISGQENPADVGTKPLGGSRLRELLFLLGARSEDHEEYGLEDYQQSVNKKALGQAMKNLRLESGARTKSLKAMLPLMVMLCQIYGAEGLGLTALAMVDDETLTRMTATLAVGLLFALVFLGLPWAALRVLWGLFFRAGAGRRPCQEAATQTEAGATAPNTSRGTQSSLGMSKDERLFQEEYVQRCTELRSALYDAARENESMERALREVRVENNDLGREVARLRTRTAPEQIVVATSRGERYHLPNCGNVRHSNVKRYSPCLACLGRG